MGSVVAKTIVDRTEEYFQEKAKQREFNNQSNEGYEVVKYTKEYSIRKYPPYVAALLLTPPNNDAHNPLFSYAYGLSYSHFMIPPQNTRKENLLASLEEVHGSVCDFLPDWAKPHNALLWKQRANYYYIISITPIPKKVGELLDQRRWWELRLPDVYTRVEDAPQPWDKRVVLRQVEGRVYVVARVYRPMFPTKVRDDDSDTLVVIEEADKLRKMVERDGYKVSGDPFVTERFYSNSGPEIRIPLVLE